jgi:hypothetical protein
LGQTLLQDFNEIDRYLLDPSRAFYLNDIEDIKKWELKSKIKPFIRKIH